VGHQAGQEAADDTEADGGRGVVDRSVIVDVGVVIGRFDVDDHRWEEEETGDGVDHHQVHDQPEEEQ